MVNNRFIKKLTISQVTDLVNYILPNIKPCTVIFGDDKQSFVKVYYSCIAGVAFKIIIDDFEGFLDAGDPLNLRRSGTSYMDAAEQIRFHAWMYQNFREAYLKELARFLNKKYRSDCR